MNRLLFLVKWAFLFVMISGCSAGEFESKDEITKALEQENYDQVQQYIEDHLEDNDKSDIVSFAIASMVESKRTENIKFLQDMYKKLVEREDFVELENLAFYLEKTEAENESDSSLFYDVQQQILYYRDLKDQLPEVKKDNEKLKSERDQLVSTFPYDIPVVGKKVEGFSGVILQKINPTTYLVRHNVVNAQYVLITTQSEFTSAGQFALFVVHGGVKNYTLQNGFTQNFEVLYEIPEQYKDLIDELNDLESQIVAVESDMKSVEDSIEANGTVLNNRFESWFMENGFDVGEEESPAQDSHQQELSDKSPAALKKSAEEIKKNFTLGMSLQDIEELVGSPTDEIDLEYYPHPDRLYDYQGVSIKTSWNEDWTLAEYSLEYAGEGDSIIQFSVYSDGTEEEKIF